MMAYLDSEYPGQLDTMKYLSRDDQEGLAENTKALRQTLEI